MRGWVLAGIVAAGLASRIGRTGFLVVDKYLGDALYAAMVYELLRMTGRVRRVWLWAGVAMVGIECFQLTGVGAAMVRSEWWAARVCGRLLGTAFGWGDLAAYGVGIGVMAWAERRRRGRCYS